MEPVLLKMVPRSHLKESIKKMMPNMSPNWSQRGSQIGAEIIKNEVLEAPCFKGGSQVASRAPPVAQLELPLDLEGGARANPRRCQGKLCTFSDAATTRAIRLVQSAEALDENTAPGDTKHRSIVSLCSRVQPTLYGLVASGLASLGSAA